MYLHTLLNNRTVLILCVIDSVVIAEILVKTIIIGAEINAGTGSQLNNLFTIKGLLDEIYALREQ